MKEKRQKTKQKTKKAIKKEQGGWKLQRNGER